MSHIVQLNAENIKRLRAVNIRPDGHMVIIGGNNGQGKSSVLDSICMAFGGQGEVPEVPVRIGEERAAVVVELDDLIVERHFTPDGKSNLVVKDKKGRRMSSPQMILNEMTGKLTFDPLAFIGMGSGLQAETLRKLVGLDFSALNAQRQRAYDDRTIANREVASAKALLQSLPTYPDAPAAEQSAAEILAEIEKAQAHNNSVAQLTATREAAEKALSDKRDALDGIDDEISDIEAEIEKLQAKLQSKRAARAKSAASIAECEAALEKAKQSESSATLQSVDGLKARLASLESLNAKVRANAAFAKAQEDLEKKQAKADDLTRQIDEFDRTKAEALASTKFPVAGLSFNDTGVLFEGVPFSQASQAQRIRVSVAIAAAMNPKLKVMMVRDGSLLDANSLRLLGELAAEFGLQVWVERVGKDASCSVIIEDGAVSEVPASIF